MTPYERLRLSIASARYLEAMEQFDEATLAALWDEAAGDAELLAAFRELHLGLIEAREAGEKHVIESAVETHLTSAEIVRPSTGPITVGDVANELFRNTPDRLPAAAHALNEQLRSSSEPVPANLGLSSLTAWAEAKFGASVAEYWKAFRQAAFTLEFRRTAEVEYHLAARTAPKPGDRK